MKKLAITLGISVLATLSVAEINAYSMAHKKKEKLVTHTFHHAKNIHRFNLPDGMIEYDFMWHGSYVSAKYTPEGSIVETDYSIQYKDLPEKIKEYIQTNYKSAAIIEIVKEVTKQSFCYKIRLEENENEISILSSMSGDIMVGY